MQSLLTNLANLAISLSTATTAPCATPSCNLTAQASLPTSSYTIGQNLPTPEPTNQSKDQQTTLVLEPVSQPPKTGLSASLLTDLVNAYRLSHQLTAFESESNLCSLATIRSKEIKQEIDGAEPIHWGFKTRSYQYNVSENLIRQRSEASALNWWLNSPVHKNTLDSDNKYMCIVCQGNDCTALFSNF